MTHYNLRPGNPWLTKFVSKALTRAGILPYKRNFIPVFQELAPYGGSEWWALTRDACEYILDFTNTRKKVVQFFRNTFCPGELFFQTILANSYFNSSIASDLTYADWRINGPHPPYLTEEHIQILRSIACSPDNITNINCKLFARKLSDASDDLVARIEREIW